MQHKTLLAALATAGVMTIAHAAHQVTITTKITVDSSLESDVVEEARLDSKTLHEKYSGVRGIRSVESSIDSERCPCNKPKPSANEEATDKCGCNKPRPSANEDDVACERCGCNKPRPSANDDATQEVRCDVCGKPKPQQPKCGCNKPRPSANEDAGDKCCGKPRPSVSEEEAAGDKCCGKPRPSVNEEEAAGDKCGCKPKPSGPVS